MRAALVISRLSKSAAASENAAVYPDAGATYSDSDAAALYDLLNPWDPAIWPSDAFYDELVTAAG
jgi:hypothetical protein